MGRITLVGAAVFLCVSTGWAQETPQTNRARVMAASAASPPPAFFLALGAEAAGYHVNTKMPNGFVPRTICLARWPEKTRLSEKRWARVSKAKRDCAALQRSYVTSLVRDTKEGDKYVVQELWLWVYDTPESARRAAENMDDMTLEKHPYEVWIRGTMVVILEQRWRFRSAGQALAQAVAGRLTEKDGWSPLRPLTK